MFGIHLEGSAGPAGPATTGSDVTPSVRDPIIRNAAREAGQLPSRMAALSALARDYVSARDQLDGDSVGAIGLDLASAYAETQAALARLNEGLGNADLLGAVGVEYAYDPDGASEQARAEELVTLKESAADLTVGLPGSSPLLAQAVRPASFRHQEVAGQDDLPHPPDVPAYIRDQTVKTILLIDTIDEIQSMLTGAEGQPPDAVAALRKEAAQRLQFWRSDRDGFLFLSHALGTLGHGDLLGERGQDRRTLRQTVDAVTRGVPQTVADMIATVRDARERALGGDKPGAIELLDRARERVDELATYERVKESVPNGTNGLTLDHALFVAQEAREGLREQARDLTRATLGEGLWDLRVRQLETAAPVLRVITGETGFGDSPLAAVGPAQKLSLIGTGVAAAAVFGGAAGAAWISAHTAAVAEVAAGAYATAVIAIARNPHAATALAEFVASVGFNVIEAGGLQNFLEGLKTPAGVMQLVMDVLVLKQSMGGGRYGDADADGATVPRRAPDVDEGSEFAAQVRDVLDRARALKATTIEWAKQPRRAGAQAQAVTPDGEPMAVPGRTDGDELPGFGQMYAQQLGDRRAARAARGGRRMWPTHEEWRSGYQEPPAGKTDVDIRERLLDAAKAQHPTSPDMPAEAQADLHHQQVEYFAKVEADARARREPLEIEAADLSGPDRAWHDDQIEAARRVERAAKVRPAQGRLPINHEYAGKAITVDDLDARLADLTLEAGARTQLQAARKAMVESGITRIAITDEGYPDFSPWVYEKGGKRAEIDMYLNATRGRDDTLANERFAAMIGEPRFKPPKGWTWHHSERVGRMLLVPAALHDAFKHTGGVPIWRVLTGRYDGYRKTRSTDDGS